MSGTSVTTGTREESVFTPQAFRGLEKGQFIGFTADCNIGIFRGTVMVPRADPREIEEINQVNNIELLDNFKRIIDNTKSSFA